MSQAKIAGNEAADLAKDLIRSYFKTQAYPFTRHHIDSYDQFLREDIIRIVQSQNPILLLKDLIPKTNNTYRYKVEIYMGGKQGTGFYIGTPTISLHEASEVRVLYPNEARLRNLTYASLVLCDVYMKITIMMPDPEASGRLMAVEHEENWVKTAEKDERLPIMKIPIMLHSHYCLLNNKPSYFLRDVGECEYDYGGYFIINGAEKVLVTHQEQAFNTLYIDHKENDPMMAVYANIKCLSPTTRSVHQISFCILKSRETIQVSLPMVRKPIPLFVLFRAMGVQSDYDIIRLIFPDEDSAEAKMMEDMLMPSIQEAMPFLDQYSAIQYMKTMTKNFSEAHILDILYYKTFTHIQNKPGARVAFLAECVRRILRVYLKIDQPTDRDDIRNQRCLSSGFLTQMLFQGVYKNYKKITQNTIEKEYAYNDKIYSGLNFKNIFLEANRNKMFSLNTSMGESFLTDGIMRAFKGKWSGAVGEDKQGVLQSLSRLSYHDFLSHCRRMNLEFDTSLKIQGPRRLHPSQYGYFCTNETPTGGSIGITKNLSLLTAISTSSNPTEIIDWLYSRGGVIQCDAIPYDVLRVAVPVYINGGILGYSLDPMKLTHALKLLKRTGCLPASVSVGFSIDERRVFLYLDEGRPLRPLIVISRSNIFPEDKLRKLTKWRDLVLGTLPETAERDLSASSFIDPFQKREDTPTLDEYIQYLEPYTGAIEYVDPYEHNLTYIANYPEYVIPETSHVEIHPSTMFGLMTNMIPFANHNQAPRNQLSCSQSKQGLSIYSTRYKTRFDNQVHVLCYGEAPLCRTIYYDYAADGNIGYGHNLILAIGSFTGYNQDDGIVMNKDSFDRGMFRNMTFRSYQAFEENDKRAKTKTRIANPSKVPAWTEIAKGLDYTKLDERGIVRKGTYVDQNTVIVGRYIQVEGGPMRDASLTPQVWTSGRVDDVIVLVDNQGLRLVKVKVVHDRIPELGDKFSNRHGQKGTIGMLIPAVDMPRTRDGLVPDMIMNPHAIPSRMTIAQLLETMFGKAACLMGGISNGTSFMNDGNPGDYVGPILEDYGFEKYGNEILYDGTTGVQIPTFVFIGNCYTMRLKHMTVDKWNARGAGRREKRTHQPTGGRGNEGGLRIGEMERDAIAAHGTDMFLQESFMKRSDQSEFIVCNGCGTVPIYNEGTNFYLCPLCDGPVEFAKGDKDDELTLLPPNKKSIATFSKISMPYATYLLTEELTTYLNMGVRILTTKNVEHLRRPDYKTLLEMAAKSTSETDADQPLTRLVLPDTQTPEFLETETQEVKTTADQLALLGVLPSLQEQEDEKAKAIAAAVADGRVAPGSVVTATTVSLPGQIQAQGQPRMVQLGDTLETTAPPPYTTMLRAEATEFVPPGTVMVPPQGSVPPPPPPAGVLYNAQGNPMNYNMIGGYGHPFPMMGGAPQQQQQQQPQPLYTEMGQQPQPIAQQQVVTTTYIPPLEAQIITGAIPGGPVNIAVDTSDDAMRAIGLPPAPPRQNGARPATPRSSSPSFQSQGGGPPPASNTKVTVIKQG